MKISKILFVAFLFGSSLLRANSTPIPIPSIESFAFGKDSCELPAPTNFHVKAIGPNWVTLAWDNPPTPRAHRIRIYRDSDNFLLSTNIVLAGISEETIPIPFNTKVNAVINAICLDGRHSPNIAEDRFQGVILEVVVTGYQGSNNSSSCDIVGSGTCDFEGSGYTTFKLSWLVNGTEVLIKKFDVSLHFDPVEQAIRYKFFLQSGNNNNNNTFSFYCRPNINPDCTTDLINVTLRQNGNEISIANIDAYQTSSTNTLKADLYNYGNHSFRIDRLTPYNPKGQPPPPPPGLISERDNNASGLASYTATASPNPFSESLDVFPGNPTAESIHLQMYNLSGQKVLDQQFPGGQEQYSLSTATLSTGFYLLRIEADGEVQTLKVIKSE